MDTIKYLMLLLVMIFTLSSSTAFSQVNSMDDESMNDMDKEHVKCESVEDNDEVEETENGF